MSRTRRRLLTALVIVAGILVVGVIVGLGVANSILLGRSRAAAAEWSQRLERPIEIGGVSAHLFPTGLTVSGLKLGAAKGEELPLATVDKAEVNLHLLPVLFSGGKKLHVSSAEIKSPVINLVRFPDGTTNWSRFKDKLDSQNTGKPSPQNPEPPEKSSNPPELQVDSAKLVSGKIQLLDLSGPSKHQVAISDIDLSASGIEPGRPLDVKLSADILGNERNFEVDVHSSPLPPSLKPVVEQIAIKIKPLDLAPLAPFFPKQFPLLQGRIDADWKANLGAAAPGGKGATQFSGTLHAQGLQFAGAEKGKLLDAALETQIEADVEKGDLSLDKLRMQLGPATLLGSGRVHNFSSDKPSVENLQLTAQNLDLALLSQYYPPLRKQLKGEVAGPIGLQIRGSGTGDKPSIVAQLDFTPVRISLPEQMTKAAGAPMTFQASLMGAQNANKEIGFDVSAHLAGVDLRPGGLLNKGAGDKMDFSAQGFFQQAGSKESRKKLDLRNLRVDLLGDTLSAKGTAEISQAKNNVPAVSFAFQLQSPHLDADRLLLSKSSSSKAPPSKPTARRAPGTKAPAPNPHRYDGIKGQIAANIGAFKMEGIQLSNVQAEVRVFNGEITVEKLNAQSYGGKLSADGSKVNLASADRPFDINFKAQNVELGQALARGGKQVLAGKFTGDTHLTGSGSDAAEIRQKLVGNLKGNLEDAAFLGKDLIADLTGTLSKALPFAAQDLSVERSTSLGRELPFGVAIENGVANLKSPIRIQRPDATVTLNGGIRLDGQLQMAGTAELSPGTISKITRGKASVQQPIPLAFHVVGPAWSPQLGVDVGPAVQNILRNAAQGAANRFLGKVLPQGSGNGNAPADAKEAAKKLQDEAGKKFRGLFGGQ